MPRLFALLATLLCTFSVAHAKVNETWKSGNWLVEAYFNDATSKFQGCSITTPYRSGITLSIFLDPNKLVGIGLTNPNWVFQPDQIYWMKVSVDRLFTQNSKAVITNEHQLGIYYTEAAELVGHLRRGNLLTIVAQQQTFQFNLIGTNLALDLAQQCMTRYAGTPGGSNPFAGGGQNPFEPPSGTAAPQPPAAKGPSREAVDNVLRTAKLTYTFVPSADDSEIAWSYGIGTNIRGAAGEFVLPKNVSAVEYIGYSLGTLTSKCSSGAASGTRSNEQVNGFAIIQSFATCSSDHVTNYISAMAAEGRIVIFLTLTADDPNTAGLINDRLSEALHLLAVAKS